MIEKIREFLRQNNIDFVENYINGEVSFWGFDKERATEFNFAFNDFPDDENIDNFESHFVDEKKEAQADLLKKYGEAEGTIKVEN